MPIPGVAPPAAFADDLALGVAPWVATAGAGVSVSSCCTAREGPGFDYKMVEGGEF